MKRREPVEHIMSKSIETVNVTNSIYDAKHKMEELHIRHLPVVSGDSLIEILSITDVHRLSFGKMYEDQKEASRAMMEMYSIEEVMVSNPKTIQSNATVKEVAETFAREDFHALPVLEDDKLVGIVTTTDVMNYLVDLF
jgi:CBS domain-containing protein